MYDQEAREWKPTLILIHEPYKLLRIPLGFAVSSLVQLSQQPSHSSLATGNYY